MPIQPQQTGLESETPHHDTSDRAVLERRFWNDWNANGREKRLTENSERQSRVIHKWMRQLLGADLSILDVGCGTGWMSERLLAYGTVTATDLADEVLERARHRSPKVTYVAGDFMDLDLGTGRFDIVVALEVLSHVSDQPAFVRKLNHVLKPGGILMLSTQNRWVVERCPVQPKGEGQIRKWTSARELRRLLAPHFDIKTLFSVSPDGNRGVLRLINSVKLNLALSQVVGTRRVIRWKERAGLGRTLMAYCVKRP